MTTATTTTTTLPRGARVRVLHTITRAAVDGTVVGRSVNAYGVVDYIVRVDGAGFDALYCRDAIIDVLP